MNTSRVVELRDLTLGLDAHSNPSGQQVLDAVLRMASAALSQLQAEAQRRRSPRIAAVGRLRGTGRGIHFTSFVQTLERERPLELKSPFEASRRVAGAAWPAVSIPEQDRQAALAKLRWAAGADDLPLHVHETSDRFIIVNEGRGFFHVSGQSVDDFDGRDVRSIPARERDVFIFTRGTVHTFSTLDHAMTLLSCQLPYLDFDDPAQYRLPRQIWTARDNAELVPAGVKCDPAWTLLTDGAITKVGLFELLRNTPVI